MRHGRKTKASKSGGVSSIYRSITHPVALIQLEIRRTHFDPPTTRYQRMAMTMLGKSWVSEWPFYDSATGKWFTIDFFHPKKRIALEICGTRTTSSRWDRIAVRRRGWRLETRSNSQVARAYYRH